VLANILLAASFDRAFIVRIKAHFLPSRSPHTASVLGIPASAVSTGFREEEVEELVCDGKMRLLLELLKGGQTDEQFEQR